MMLVFRLALRNLTRHPGRNLLSAIVVVAGVFVLVVGNAFIGGMRENVARAQIDTLSAHLVARPADYPKGITHPVDELIAISPELRAWLDENATAWTTRTLFATTAVTGSDSLRVRGIAFEPGRDEAVFPRDTWRLLGEIPSGADDGVLVSRGVARLLGLQPGHRLVLKTRTSAGALNALDVPVAGVFTAGNPALDNIAVFVPADLAEDLVRTGGEVSHVLVRLRSRYRSEGLAEDFRAHLPAGTEVATWQEESADQMVIMDVRERALDILSTILLLLAALGIMNTTLMAAYERVREVGTLRAMGMERGTVLALFVTEGAMVGALGGLLGVVLGGGLVWYYATTGIDLAPTLEEINTGTIPMSTMLYTEWDPNELGWAFGVGFVMASIAAIYPAWVASSMEPAEAVRAT